MQILLGTENPVTTLSALQTQRQDLIRKALEGSIFVAPFSVTDEIAAITDATGLLALPTGYDDAGLLLKEQGAAWTREVESSDSTSWGKSEPTRRDVTSDVTGLQFTMQESKRQAFEMYHGLDLSAVTFDSTTGELSFDKPDRPATIYYRVLSLAKDGEGADAIYFARWLPRAAVTDRGEQTWNESGAVQYPVTVTAYVDSTFGTSMREFWGGPALLGGLATAMGFTGTP